MKKIFLLTVIVSLFFQCSKSKSNKNTLLGLLLLTNSSSSATNAFSAAVPSSFAISSVTEQQSVVSGSIRAVGDDIGAEDFKTKKQNMQGALSALTVSDCFKAIPKAVREEMGTVSCYGPSLTFSSHSQISGTSMPGGDLGIWQTTEGVAGEACSAAKANSLMRIISNRVDMAMGTAAAMACIAKFANLTLPSTAGASLDLASNFTSSTSGKGFGVTTAKMTRLADSGSKPQFQIEFVGTKTQKPPGSTKTITSTMDFTLKQIPTSTSNTSSYKGLLQMTITDSGGVMTKMRAISIVYEKSGTTLTYSANTAMFPTTTSKTNIFNSSTGELNKASATGGGAWTDDFHSIISSIDEDGYGKMAYGWQAGQQDGYLRTFNAETTSSNAGTAYFGFSANTGNQGNFSLKPSGIFCNWIGTAQASQRFQTKLQKQILSFSGGIWKTGVSNITFAPTNDCNHASSGAIYSGLTSNPTTLVSNVTASGAVTNDLVNASDSSFTVPTAPSYP
jgi:hypothetical protein